MNPLTTVLPGAPLARSAAAHNQSVDAVRRVRSQQRVNQVTPQPPTPTGGLVRVRNVSDVDVDRFGVLVISGVAITPGANELEFQNHPVFDCVHADGVHLHFVVAQAPIKAGAIGKAVVSGATVARLVVDDEEASSFAEAAAGSDVLVAGSGGQAEILWREGGTGVQWAIVRIGNTVSFGAGVVNLGIVVAPSSNGVVASSYTVDVYGTSMASLSSDALATSQTAIQSPALNTFYRGEVVGLVRIGDALAIQKLLTLPIAYTVTPGQIGLRLTRGAVPHNFIVDLNDCLGYFAGGANLIATDVHFNYSGFAGWGGIGVQTSIPVRMQPEWELASVFLFGNFPADPAAQASNGVTSIPFAAAYSGSVSRASAIIQSGAGFYDLTAGGQLLVNQTAWSITLPGSSLSALLWPGVSPPTITGAVDSSEMLLDYSQFSFGYNTSGVVTSGPATSVAENFSAYRVFTSGQTSRVGTYNLLSSVFATNGFSFGPPNIAGPIVVT